MCNWEMFKETRSSASKNNPGTNHFASDEGSFFTIL